MKLVRTFLATTVLVSVAGLAMAADNGGMMGNGPFYGDLNLGASTDFGKNPGAVSVANDLFPGVPLPAGLSNKDGDSFKKYNFAGSIDFGKMINQNWGVELGYTYMPGSSYNGTDTLSNNNGSVTEQKNAKVQNHVFDVALKGIYDLGNNVSLFGKLGPAYVLSKSSFDASYSGVGQGSHANQIPAVSASKNGHALALYYAVGAAYKINNNFNVNAQVSGVSNSKSSMFKKNPALMMVSAGVGYNFGA